MVLTLFIFVEKASSFDLLVVGCAFEADVI